MFFTTIKPRPEKSHRFAAFPRRPVMTAAIVAVLLAAPLPVFADITIVAKVTVMGDGRAILLTPPLQARRGNRNTNPDAPQSSPGSVVQSPGTNFKEWENGTQSVTLYYKNKKTRCESGNGKVVIYDQDAKKVYTLDPVQKVYTVAAYKNVQEPSLDLPPTISDRIDVKTKADLDAVKSGDADGAPRTIAGQSAKRYDVSGSLSLEAKSNPSFAGQRGVGFPGGGGGFPGSGGGFPGGGGGGRRRGGGGGYPGGEGGNPGGTENPNRPPKLNLPKLNLEGDVYAVALKDALGTDGANAKNLGTLFLAFGDAMLPIPGVSPLRKPLRDRLDRLHLLPLSTRLILSKSGGDAFGEDSTTDTRTSTSTSTVTINLEVESVRIDQPLADTLLTIPSDYTKVDAIPAPAPSIPAGQPTPAGT